MLFAFLSYFLLMTYLYPLASDPSLAWAALVIPAVLMPICLFGAAYAEERASPAIGLAKRFLRYDWQRLLLAFAILAPLAALLNGSPADAAAVAVLCVLFVLLTDPSARASLPLFASAAFALCVLGSVASYHLGINRFGYLPWHEAEDPTFVGVSRVSLFPYLSDSALFALSMVAVAWSFRPPLWYLTVPFATYFVYFSSSRTAIAAAGAVLLAEVLSRMRVNPTANFIIVVLLLVLVVGFADRAFPLLVELEESITGESYLTERFARKHAPRLEKFRTKPEEGQYIDHEYLLLFNKDMEEGNPLLGGRAQLWRDHVRAFSSSPLTGVGRKTAREFLQRTSVSSSITGSESFLTRILAELGIVAVLFWLAILRLFVHFSRAGNALGRGLTVGLMVWLLLYGSVAVPYSFVSLFFIALIGHALTAPAHRVSARQAPEPSSFRTSDQ